MCLTTTTTRLSAAAGWIRCRINLSSRMTVLNGKIFNPESFLHAGRKGSPNYMPMQCDFKYFCSLQASHAVGLRELASYERMAYSFFMSITAIQEAAMDLSEPDRVKLIDVLWNSLSSPGQKEREGAWAAESERRIDAFESGKLEVQDAATVFSELRANLRK
jgi:putative addiction module component (TIGR02574 family)